MTKHSDAAPRLIYGVLLGGLFAGVVSGLLARAGAPPPLAWVAGFAILWMSLLPFLLTTTPSAERRGVLLRSIAGLVAGFAVALLVGALLTR
jgi:hypothetical protein